MKRTVIALLLGSLFVATQAYSADSALPMGADPFWETGITTYADAHAGEPARVTGSALPMGADPFWETGITTYADDHTGEPGRVTGSALPMGADPFWESGITTYADTHLHAPLQFSESPQTDGTSVR